MKIELSGKRALVTGSTTGIGRAIARGLAAADLSSAARFIKEHRPTSLLQRFATVEEVAHMVVYVCSPQASATNGAALRVEGGVVRSIA